MLANDLTGVTERLKIVYVVYSEKRRVQQSACLWSSQDAHGTRDGCGVVRKVKHTVRVRTAEAEGAPRAADAYRCMAWCGGTVSFSLLHIHAAS